MPSADAILAGLTETANTWKWLAIVWHVLLAAVVVVSLARRRPSNRLVEFLAIALVVSVSAVSAGTDNPFNGIAFAGLAVLLLAAAFRAQSAPIRSEKPSRAVPGTTLVLFGTAYPHFLATGSWTEYAYAAPLGLIPCPTLAVVIGFTLMFRNLGTTAWRVPLIIAGLLYGLVGVFGLGVLLDVALLAGTLVLAIAAIAGDGRRSVRANRHEQTCRLPGDEFIVKPLGTITHGITIAGAPRDVWPWLAQMGAGSRAGWYSYDFLDNRRQRSATRIIPELQDIAIGSVFPAMPGVTEGFRVLAFEPQHYLVLGWPDPTGSPIVSWAFVLESRTTGSTRLTVRVRAGERYRFHRLPWWMSEPIVRVVHFVMQRKQLLEIAKRVDRSSSTRSVASHLPTAATRAS